MRDRRRRRWVEEFGRRRTPERRRSGRCPGFGDPGTGELGKLGLGFWRGGNRNVEEIGGDRRVEGR